MLVQTAILKLLQKIDPTLKDMTVVTASNIGTAVTGWSTVGGEKFDAQGLLDIYNDARMAVFEEFREKLGDDLEALGATVGAELVSSTTFTMTLTGSVAVGTKPTGYIKFASMSNASGIEINLLGPELLEEVRSAAPSPHYTQTSTGPIFVFETATQFVHYGTFVTTLATYRLVYFGLTNWTLTDVTAGTAYETYTDDQIANQVIPKAIAIALSRGLQVLAAPQQGA